MTTTSTGDEVYPAPVNGPADGFDVNVEASPNFEDTQADQTSLAMFEGDTGTLYPEQRRCLHFLLKHRYISAERHPEAWAVILSDEEIIKSQLNNLFLDLHVDRNFQVAFKRQASAETGDPLPSLLRDISHTKEETIVMVSLRQRFFTQRQDGEDVVFVDVQALLDEVSDQRPEVSTHRAMDHKRALNAIGSLASAGVLLKTPDPDRFRISPIIEVLMPIERLLALESWLLAQNGANGTSADSEVEPDIAGVAADDFDGTLDVMFDLEEDGA